MATARYVPLNHIGTSLYETYVAGRKNLDVYALYLLHIQIPIPTTGYVGPIMHYRSSFCKLDY